MKEEPQLVDIFAMMAMMSLLRIAPKGASNEEIAYESYEQAEAMIAERRNRYKETNDE